MQDLTPTSTVQTDGLVERLAALPGMSSVPRNELEWLAATGTLHRYEAGEIAVQKDHPVDLLMIFVTGGGALRIDRGSGNRTDTRWSAGEVTGLLPYSRLKTTPGDAFITAKSEVLLIHRDDLPDVVRHCPVFVEHTVHLMVDRARRFRTNELQNEKMISLGKLAAGLAHELNNPASAIVRAADQLLRHIPDADASLRELCAADNGGQLINAIESIRDRHPEVRRLPSPLELSSREDTLSDWLGARGASRSLSPALAEAGIETSDLDALAELASDGSLDVALRRLATVMDTRSLASDVRAAGARIHDLVGAVKRFTFIDDRSGPGPVTIEDGLRDTVRVLASKTKARDISITIDIDPQLPAVRAVGGELNQVWMNLIDNAIDAVDVGGTIVITSQQELDRAIVSIVDDGPGISPEFLTKVFDPFFTTKPPGQGTGLGLDITRRIVRLYGGEITVESRPGRTEFAVSLVVDGSNE